jgi:hypothetical protein
MLREQNATKGENRRAWGVASCDHQGDRAVCRVAEVLGLAPDRVTAFGKSPQTVEARALLCFWAQRKLGMSTIEIGRRLKISQPAASRLSKRGERIEKENRFDLIAEKGLKT